MTEDRYSQWEDIVKKTARFVARDFPEASEEDLFQDLMMFVLEHPSLEAEHEYAARGLYNRGVMFAWEYRKQALYITSQYAYRTSDVRKILETLFDYREWDASFVPSDAKTFREDDRLAVNSDLMDAYQRISYTYQECIYDRYGKNIIPVEPAEKSKLSRAIEKLTDVLNTYRNLENHEGPGRRKPISSTQARHIIQDQT